MVRMFPLLRPVAAACLVERALVVGLLVSRTMVAD